MIDVHIHLQMIIYKCTTKDVILYTMDNPRYGKHGHGKDQCSRTTDAVSRLNGKDGCKGKYFFYEHGRHQLAQHLYTGPNYNAGSAWTFI